jgi:hypothetical protein
MTVSGWWRKFFLTVHVTTSVALVGAVSCFLVVAISGLVVSVPLVVAGSYLIMQLLTWWIIVPLAAAALLLGVLQSLITPWGLFRHYWLIFKLALTLLAVVVLLLQIPTIDALAEAAMITDFSELQAGRAGMVLHSAGGLVVLLLATILSVYKPRGVTPYGAARI